MLPLQELKQKVFAFFDLFESLYQLANADPAYFSALLFFFTSGSTGCT
jgi:hypothetical protein